MSGDAVVTVDQRTGDVVVEKMGTTGLRGRDASATIARVAGEALGGQRIAAVGPDGRAYYADPMGLLAGQIAGITTGSAALGADVTIQGAGEIEEAGWSWSPGAIFLGPLGTLTQAPPAAGAIVVVGWPLGPTSFRISVQLITLR